MPRDEREIFDDVFTRGRPARTISAEDVERSGGLLAAELIELVRGFGLAPPEPDEPFFDEDEAEAFRAMARVRDIWPIEVTRQVSRVYGRLLARIAQTEAQLFRLHVESRLRVDDAADDELGGMERLGVALEQLLPIADPIIVGVHRRWLEHQVMQAAVAEVETTEQQIPLPGAMNAAILFCDLKDFTAFAVREGDTAAIRRIELLAETITERRGEDCRLTKSIGDGYMLVYPEASRAVEVGRAIIEASRSGSPGVHASVHQGQALVHEGDYFGSAVNLTARLLGAAGRDELVGSAEVARDTADRFDWDQIGTRTLRGVGEPIEVFKLVGAR